MGPGRIQFRYESRLIKCVYEVIKMMRFFVCLLKVTAVLIWVATSLMAGVTGKITGNISDKNNGEALPGVNVIIDGQYLGASTDTDGYYFILQVPPGIYTLRIGMMGYQELLIKNVRVSADQTTIIDAVLEEKVLDISKEVVIVAERPVIQKDITSSTQFVDAQELIQLPVIDAKEGIMLQAGVFFDPIPVIGGLNSAGRGEKRYSIRGGSQEEVKWYVDGVRTSSLLAGRADWGGSFTNININAVEEIQVNTGGFNAEYGEAQSGIINTITKEGSETWTGSLDYTYGFPGQHHFGNYIYDRDSQKEFLDHTLEDGSLDTSWWIPYRQAQIYDYRRIPDHNINVSLGGTLLKLGKQPLTFFMTSQHKQEAYTLPHPRNARTGTNGMLNLAYKLGAAGKLRLNLMYNHDAHSTLQENGDFTYQAKYYRGWGSVLDSYTYSASLHWSHTISPEIFYELKLSHFLVDFQEGPSKYTIPGSSETQTIWGFHRYENLMDEPFDKYSPIIKNHSVSGDYSLVGNFNWQINKANLVKTGFEFRYNISSEKESYRFPTFTTDKDLWLNRGLNETYYPIQFAAYLQDKFEMESMILNIGLRYDYFDPNRDWFSFNPLFNLSVDPLYDSKTDPDGDQVDAAGHVKYSFENVLNQPRSAARVYHMVSPRLGVSFPVTENSLLHFNYGHFYQMPPLDRMFEFYYFRPLYIVEGIAAEEAAAAMAGREPNHIKSLDGDPERVVSLTIEPLRPQKTSMFEVGLKQNIANLVVVDVTGYYKDVFNQTEERIGLFDRKIYGYDPFRNATNANVAYAAFIPGDYGDSRGFEISMRTLFGNWYAFDVNYSFSKAARGRATPAVVTIMKDGTTVYGWDTDVNKRIPVEKSFSRPHIFRANLFVEYPDGFTGTWMDKMCHQLSAKILYRFISGQAFTYLSPDDPPDTYDNYRYPAFQTVDLRLEKTVRISGRHMITLYSRITNLLNAKNLRSIGDAYYFNPNDILGNYVENGQPAEVDLAGYDISWQTYHEKRRISIGFRYFF